MMKPHHFWCFAFVAILLNAAPAQGAPEEADVHPISQAWGRTDPHFKAGIVGAWVSGFYYGLDYLRTLAASGHPVDAQSDLPARPGTDELVAGLNEFYKNPHNAKINMQDALFYVLMVAHYGREPSTDAMLRDLRALSTDRP